LTESRRRPIMRMKWLTLMVFVIVPVSCFAPLQPLSDNSEPQAIQQCRFSYDSCLTNCRVVFSNDTFMYGTCTENCKNQFVTCAQSQDAGPLPAMSKANCSPTHRSCITNCNIVFKDNNFMRNNCYRNCDNDLQRCIAQ